PLPSVPPLPSPARRGHRGAQPPPRPPHDPRPGFVPPLPRPRPRPRRPPASLARPPRARHARTPHGAGGALEAGGEPHRARRLHLHPGAARLRAGHRCAAVLLLPRARGPALVDCPGERGRRLRAVLPDLCPRAPRAVAGGAVELISGLLYGFAVSFTPANLFACFVGVFIGTLIGVLPGIGPVATMSLLLPVTYAMSPTASIIMMAGIYYG